MTVSEPAWRIKSRPCPFYQHGQCLFADSCNFLHNVSAKLSSGACKIESSHKLDHFVPQTMPTPPIISVDSPRSINSSHSPGLSGLLDALEDVIGEDAINIAPDPPRTPYSPDKPTLVDDSEITFISGSPDKEEDGNMTVDILGSYYITSGGGNPSVSQGIFPDNDEGDAEGYKPTVGFSDSRTKSASFSSERPRPSQLNIETAMPPIFDFSEKNIEGVIDSGYAESWDPHSPSPRTPPRTRNSTLVLLGSPFGSPSDRIQAQAPGILGKLGLNASVEQLLDATSDNSLDCTKDCDSPRHVLILHAAEDISAEGEDIAQTSLGILANNVSLRSCTDLSQSQAVIEPTNSGRKSDELALLSSNGSEENVLKPGLELGLQEKTIKDLFSKVKNIPSGDPHSWAESVPVASPTPPDKQNSPETLDKNTLSCDTTQSALANSDNKSTSCGASPLPTTSRSSPHNSSSLNSQRRFSTSTPRQSYYDVRNFMSNTTSSSADGARRMSFGWKNWGKSRTRASDPAMSQQPKKSLTRRSSESGITAGQASDRKHSGFVSPTRCPSSGRASLSPSAVVSPGHTTIIHMPNPTSIFTHAESSTRASISMLSLSSSVSSTKYPTPDYLPTPPCPSIHQQVSTSIPTPDASIPSPLSFTSLDLKNFSENAPCSTDSYDFVDCHDPSELSKYRISKQSLEPPLYRIDENEDSRIEDQHGNGYVDSHDPSELRRFQFPKRNPEPPLYRIEEHEDSRIEDQIPTPVSLTSRSSRPSVFQTPPHAIAIPKPTLFFAIATDNADEVRKVLESGEVGPNESVGPQSALEFTLANGQLMHKAEIVKILLAYGADPSVVKKHRERTGSITPDSDSESGSKPGIVGTIDPATRYFLEKAEVAERQRTTALMRRSSFRAITRVRYEIVGQDRVLEHLFKVLSIHTRQLSPTPLVVLFSGPSGHGKSILARKFGSLIEVPTHIVNMTTLRAPHELWQSHSMDPDSQTSTTSTLANFLTKNEGKRCVVVLDEIEKTADEKVLWSLLMPWEHGRCSIEAGSPPIDVRNVVWIGTSNVGQDLVFEYQAAREQPQETISKEEYTELMELVRPKMSSHLGTAVVSRVTAILPFVPFTAEERRVICFEALYSLARDEIRELFSQLVDRVIENALAKFRPEEGARSLYRAISEQLAIHL